VFTLVLVSKEGVSKVRGTFFSFYRPVFLVIVMHVVTEESGRDFMADVLGRVGVGIIMCKILSNQFSL
jgi:hypothetical protein